MTIYSLISRYQEHNPNGHFFDHDTLKFFGERISEMIVHKTLCNITDVSGDIHTCYCVSSLQHKHPGGRRRVYHYFDIETYAHIIR